MIECSTGEVQTNAPADWASEQYCYRYASLTNRTGLHQSSHIEPTALVGIARETELVVNSTSEIMCEASRLVQIRKSWKPLHRRYGQEVQRGDSCTGINDGPLHTSSLELFPTSRVWLRRLQSPVHRWQAHGHGWLSISPG